MSPFASAVASWLRHHLGWSTSPESRLERLGTIGLVSAGLIAWWLHGKLTAPQELLTFAALVLVFCILLRRGWVRLAGPVLFYELVCIARRLRYRLFRIGYALLLALLLCWMYVVVYMENLRFGAGIAQMAAFAGQFFLTFTIVQFIVVIVLTPAYTAGAVADEKERRTIEFLLATDLRNREIILSKLLSRLANLFLLLLAGLPVLAFLQFLGGVDPNLMLACFAATAVTAFSVAALSILSSVTSRKARDAIALTYLAIAAYLIISGAARLLPQAVPASWPSTHDWQSPVTVGDAVDWLNTGNIFSAYFTLLRALESHLDLSKVLAACLRDYVLFHTLFGFIFIAWSIARVRAIALKQAVTPQGGRSSRWWRLWRPRLRNSPMLWKELFAESGLRFNALGRIAVLLLALGTVFPLGLIVSNYFGLPWGGGPYHDWRWLSESMNVWVRIVGSASACLMLLGVAARASSCFSGERDRQTLDSLLTTPLTDAQILGAKWLGSVLSMRWGWAWLGSVYVLGILTEALHPVALLLLVIAWFVYATVFSLIGLLFSMSCRTTLRSTISTLLVCTAVGVGHWLVWMCCGPLLAFSRSGQDVDLILRFQAGLTPPVTLGYAFAFPLDMGHYAEEQAKFIAFAIIGLLCWLVSAFVLWVMCRDRFSVVTYRKLFRAHYPGFHSGQNIQRRDE
jgi:ABC-type transport system involved in multi-copper enzyme maturation permease subunit